MSALVFVVALYATLGAAAVTAGDLPSELSLRPGFQLELVYRVPRKEGSWVALTADGRGGLIASDQDGSLYQVAPQPRGRPASESEVARMDLPIGRAQGLAVVGDNLYVMVNGKSGDAVTGLYRLRDKDGNGTWDDLELLRQLGASGEHGPHAIVPAPDGKSLYVACGNVTRPTEFSRSAVVPVVAEDALLARLPGPNPYAIGIPAPGGWIARVDPGGKNWELFSVGYRNQYDLAINRDGELFTYDSDMEYDIGTPWYHPTRILHVTSGSDFGWRSGSGKWPAHFTDTLPAVADIGPGSPTGLAFGCETRFPPRYRDALYAADWGRGVIQAVHLQPSGASYTSTWEPFVRATPLPVTDLAVNPHDGALYFTVGGRGIESALYRVVYRGNDDTPVAAADAPENQEARKLRRQLETFHAQAADQPAVDTAWPHLSNPDRFIRYAARTAMEHQPLALWRDRALGEENPIAQIQAAIALARRGMAGDTHRAADRLSAVAWEQLDTDHQLSLLRAYQLVISRHSPLPTDVTNRIAQQLLQHFPADDVLVTRDMATVLTRFVPEKAVPLVLSLFTSAWTDEDRIHYLHVLCDVRSGWTTELRTTYGRELASLAASHSDRTHAAFLDQMAERVLDAAPIAERAALAAMLADARRSKVTATHSKPKVRQWTTDEVTSLLQSADRTPDVARGRRLFSKVRCADCHAIAGRGGAVGPDLTTAASRLSLEDLVPAVIQPDLVISDQYRQTVFEVNGRTLVGRVIDQHEGKVRIATDMTDPKRSEFVLTSDIERQSPSPVSPMPTGLLDVLNAEEIVDLFGYLQQSRQTAGAMLDRPYPVGSANADE